MKHPLTIEPPGHYIATHTMQLRTNAKFAEEYDRHAEVCRAIYNMAVAEAALDGPERLAHLSYVPKKKGENDDDVDGGNADKKKEPYLDPMSYKLAGEVARTTGMSVAEIRKSVFAQLGGLAWCYAFPPSSRATRNRIGLLLTQLRAKHEWMRDCPVQYELGAIREAVTAVDRSISDGSARLPFRPDGRHAPLYCPSNQAVNRKKPHVLRVPGFTLYTKKAIPQDWDIASCRIVETTPHRTRASGRGGRTFEAHIQVKVRTKRQPVNVLMRAVDAGGKHVAATADTVRRTTLQTMPHTPLWGIIRGLQSQRDRKKKGSHAWLKLDKQTRIMREKANRVAENARMQGAAWIVRGVLYVVVEGINIKALAAHGGSRKRRLNDMLRLAGIGGFRGRLIRNAARRGAYIVLVDARDSSNECLLCGCVDSDNRATRDELICITCGDKAHADINAACVLLKRGEAAAARRVDGADGRAVLRRRAKPRNQSTRWSAWPRKRGLDPPRMMRWGRQKITQLEAVATLPGL